MIKSIIAYAGQPSKILQLFERCNLRVALEYLTKLSHSGCLCLTQLSIVVRVPVSNADCLHVGIGKGDIFISICVH